jgi:hypothetical protein
MADRNPLVQQLEDRNTAYAVMRAIEHHGGPSVLVCDPATRASVAVIFPIAEWDAIAKIHNETVDELEALEEEYTRFMVQKACRDAEEVRDAVRAGDSVSPGPKIQGLSDNELANLLGEVAEVKTTSEPREYRPNRPYDDPIDPGWEKRKLPVQNREDTLSPGVHNFMDYEPGLPYLATRHVDVGDYSELNTEEVAQEGPKAVERKNLQRRVKEQRKQLDMLTEQAKGRKKEISYWKAVSQANLDTLNHYGIRPPKIKAVRPEGSDESEFQAVGGYL